MNEHKFASEYAKQNNLALQIADAVKSWRIAALDYQKVLSQWHAETDKKSKDSIWQRVKICEQIRDGALAQIQLLADRYIDEAI